MMISSSPACAARRSDGQGHGLEAMGQLARPGLYVMLGNSGTCLKTSQLRRRAPDLNNSAGCP
jgi:hypothetical protein